MSNPTTNLQPARQRQRDDLPRFGIGHVSMTGADIDLMADFYEEIGMRLVVNTGRMVILELRGGTHIVIGTGPAGVATLDLIVDDIDGTRAILEAAGADPSLIQRGNPHDRFVATDPEGNTLHVNSNHAIGPV
ncbi:VOC family protein [Ilumatobacter sp.]|uniref:VOC family protein n=1 Tax=Ilumatobacter sp. TaxID=1967498 RepID=UPI003AF80A15